MKARMRACLNRKKVRETATIAISAWGQPVTKLHMKESESVTEWGKRSARRFEVPGSRFKVIRIFAAWRLCVSHPFCAETYGDSCNSSLQHYETNPLLFPYQCLIRVSSVATQGLPVLRSLGLLLFNSKSNSNQKPQTRNCRWQAGDQR